MNKTTDGVERCLSAGRQQMNWTDDLLKLAQKHWTRKTQDEKELEKILLSIRWTKVEKGVMN